MILKGQREGGRLGEEGDMLGCIRVQGAVNGEWISWRSTRLCWLFGCVDRCHVRRHAVVVVCEKTVGTSKSRGGHRAKGKSRAHWKLTVGSGS